MKIKRHVQILLVSIFFLGCSQRQSISLPIADIFPDAEKMQNSGFGFIFFFSPNNCVPCLDVSRKVNEISVSVPVVGVVADCYDDELENLKTKYVFPIMPLSDKFKDFVPLLSPALVAVDKKFRVLMVLPGLSGQDEYIEKIVWELAAKALSLHDV